MRVWQPPVRRDLLAPDLAISKVFGENVGCCDPIARLESKPRPNLFTEQLGEKTLACPNIRYTNAGLNVRQDKLEHLVVGAPVRYRAYLVFGDGGGHHGIMRLERSVR